MECSPGPQLWPPLRWFLHLPQKRCLTLEASSLVTNSPLIHNSPHPSLPWTLFFPLSYLPDQELEEGKACVWLGLSFQSFLPTKEHELNELKGNVKASRNISSTSQGNSSDSSPPRPQSQGLKKSRPPSYLSGRKSTTSLKIRRKHASWIWFSLVVKESETIENSELKPKMSRGKNSPFELYNVHNPLTFFCPKAKCFS